MIASIERDGYIHIVAENTAEVFALKYMAQQADAHRAPVVIHKSIDDLAKARLALRRQREYS